MGLRDGGQQVSTVVKNGAVSLAKALMDHEVWHLEPFSRGQAWVDLILAANDSNRTFLAQGRPVEVFRGQTGYSLKSLARRWKWSDEKVAGFILWLERAGMVSRKSSGVTTVMTILNYETYNPPATETATETDAGPATETATDPSAQPPATETATETATENPGKQGVSAKNGKPTPRPTGQLPEQKVEGRRLEGEHPPRAAFGLTPDWSEVVAFIADTEVAPDFARDWFERKVNSLTHGFDTLRDWRFDLLTYWRRNGGQKKPSENGAVNGHTIAPRPKSLGAEIMDAENTRKRVVAQMIEHPCNELSASYDPDTDEHPAWRALQATLRAVEHTLRSIPRDAPEDWQRRLRKEAFQRAQAEHPGNPESTSYDMEYCTDALRAEFLALRKEAV